MTTLKDTPLGEAANVRFLSLAKDLTKAEQAQLERSLPDCVRRARRSASHWDFCAPANVVLELIGNTQLFPEGATAAGRFRLLKAVTARLALDFFEVTDRLPASVLAEYEWLWLRLSAYAAERIQDEYPYEYFAKDVRFALGLTVPCGALAIDLAYSIGPKLVARAVIGGRTITPALDYLRSRGWGRWYNDHMDPRDLREFNPAGWTASFRRFAEMLDLNPSVRGITGVSWFYDPVVAEISPNLAYVQQPQVEHGAFRIRVGGSDLDVKNATSKSNSRRLLYEEGRYTPTGYLLAWPRRPLLRWAAALDIGASRPFEAWQVVRPSVRPDLMVAGQAG